MRLSLKSFGGVSRALAHREYRFYVSGHVVHVMGWWGNRIGLGWLAWELTRSPSFLGIIAFASLIPVMVIGPFAGALADRYGHRRVALRSGTGIFLTTFAIGAIALAGHMTAPLLVALTLLQGLFFGIDFPARQSLIPQLVDRASISAAVAFNASSFHLGAFIGPLIAGVLITRIGSGASILMSACTSAWMLTMIWLIRRDPVRPRDPSGPGIFADLLEGFRYVGRTPSLLFLLCMSFAGGLLIRPFHDLLPGFADTVFGRGAEGLATLNAAAGLGALAGALFLLVRGRTEGLTRIMLTGAFAAGSALLLFTLTERFWLAAGFIFLVSLSLLSVQVGSNSLLQTIAKPDMRGRTISMSSSVSVGGPALGALIMGFLADRFGLQTVLGISALAGIMIYIVLAPALLRRRKTMEHDHHRQIDVAPAS